MCCSRPDNKSVIDEADTSPSVVLPASRRSYRYSSRQPTQLPVRSVKDSAKLSEDCCGQMGKENRIDSTMENELKLKFPRDFDAKLSKSDFLSASQPAVAAGRHEQPAMTVTPSGIVCKNEKKRVRLDEGQNPTRYDTGWKNRRKRRRRNDTSSSDSVPSSRRIVTCHSKEFDCVGHTGLTTVIDNIAVGIVDCRRDASEDTSLSSAVSNSDESSGVISSGSKAELSDASVSVQSSTSSNSGDCFC